MAENIREIVLDTLLTMEKEKQFSNRLIKAVLDKYDYLDTRDKSFIKRLTEGTTERRIELDYYLNTYSSVPVNKMKPLIRCLMRMSVYQLLYMDNVPDSAVCNEACKLAMKRKFTNLKGFVNGVLRNISRNKENLSLPDAGKEPVKYLSVKFSCPEWLTEIWLKEYGPEMTEKMLNGLLQVHPVSLRFRSTLPEKEREALIEEIRQSGADLEQNRYLPYLYTLRNSDNIGELPGFAEGLWTVQDVSSALAVEAAGITAEDVVLDACAAPGGKSILASEKGKTVYSRDLTEEKTGLIVENVERMNASNIIVQEWDATIADESMKEKCDVVILDVPCSGLGIIGKKRDIKYRTTPEILTELKDLQKKIVKTCSAYVKPGGTLLYSTCTIHKGENEEMVRWINEELGFVPQSLKGRIPELLQQEKEITLQQRKKNAALTGEQSDACIQLLPGTMEADGFFFAVFKKPE
ncbi:MAG: 16S rRNA (cytosine(967)-C(5))-methyltransferase RsmB [Acetatifactor sp.]|nr:16S rRNA (cytosine(967)-C(5))-methyltransferase RsmB [Acetatifactor sp.]